MSAALKAHMRLIETTPRERITTHQRSYSPPRMQGRSYPNGFPRDMLEEFKSLVDRGYTYSQIRKRMQIGPRTYYRLRIVIVGMK